MQKLKVKIKRNEPNDFFDERVKIFIRVMSEDYIRNIEK